MIELLARGGLLVGPILMCSVIAAAVFIERLICLWRAGRGEPDLTRDIFELVSRGREDLALETAKQSRSPMARLLSGALEVRGRDPRVAQGVIAHTIEESVQGLSRYLGALATIGSIAPMLGLLGTVTGMIKAFMVIQETGGKVNAAVLAGGIWEAMLTTALGLIVALPAILAHNWLDAKVMRFEARLRSAVMALAKIMDDR